MSEASGKPATAVSGACLDFFAARSSVLKSRRPDGPKVRLKFKGRVLKSRVGPTVETQLGLGLG